MAYIEKRQGSRGTHYRVRVRDPRDGSLTSRTFRRRAEAEAWLHTQEAAKSAGTYRHPREGKQPFGEYVEAFLAGAVDLRPATVALYRTMAERYVNPDLGGRSIASLRPQDLRRWMVDLIERGVGAPTVQTARRLVARVLRQAVSDGIIPSNPADHAPPPRSVRRPLIVLTPADIAALTDAIDPRYKAMVLAAAYCGLRFGEAAALRRADLDMLRRRLSVTRALSEVRGVVSEGRTKTTGSIRTIVMPRVVVEAIAEHLVRYPDADGSDLVFTAPAGGYVRRTNWRRRVWARAVQAAGLKAVRPHDLRHFGAAVAIAAGAHPKQVQARLGHASIRTTLDVYGALFPGLDDELAGKLDELVAASEAGAKPSQSVEVYRLEGKR